MPTTCVSANRKDEYRETRAEIGKPASGKACSDKTVSLNMYGTRNSAPRITHQLTLCSRNNVIEKHGILSLPFENIGLVRRHGQRGLPRVSRCYLHCAMIADHSTRRSTLRFETVFMERFCVQDGRTGGFLGYGHTGTPLEPSEAPKSLSMRSTVHGERGTLDETVHVLM